MRFAKCILLGLSLYLIFVSDASSLNEYTFEIDDYNVKPKIIQCDESSGTIFDLKFMQFLAPEPGNYKFQFNDQRNCVYLLNPDGTKTVVAVTIGEIQIRTHVKLTPEEKAKQQKDRDPNMFGGMLPFGLGEYRVEYSYKNVNPLNELKPEEINKLWALNIKEWQGDSKDKLKYVNPDKVIINVSGMSQENALEYIPENIKYLSIKDYYDSEKEIKALSRFKNLRLLMIYYSKTTLDLSFISNNEKLCYLNFIKSNIELKNTHSLSQLNKLKFLKMNYMKDLSDIDFISSLNKLERLDISDSSVTDLTCLADSKQLKYVNATRCPINKLPTKIAPNLEIIKLMGSKLSERQLKDFQKQNPDCAVVYDWNNSIDKMLVSTEKIEITDCYEWTCEPQVVITKENEIKELIENIYFDPSETDVSTLCSADCCLNFYNEQGLIATFELVCDSHVRWKDATPREISLTQKSGDYLANLLAKHGYPDMKEDREKLKDEFKESLQESRKSLDEFLETLPKELAGKILAKYNSREQQRIQRRQTVSFLICGMIEDEENHNDIKEIILSEFPNKIELAGFCFKKIAILKLRSPYSYLFRDILIHIEPEILQKAISQMIKSPDLKDGVVKWFFMMNGYEYLDFQTNEKNFKDIIMAAFDSPYKEDRLYVIKELGDIDIPTSKQMLREILRGKIIDKLSEEKIAESYQETKFHNRLWRSISYRAQAAISLARLNDFESLAYIKRLHKMSSPDDLKNYEEALEIFKDRERLMDFAD